MKKNFLPFCAVMFVCAVFFVIAGVALLSPYQPLSSILLTSLAKSLVYAGRDDDEEDKALLERWAKSFGDSLTND
ncbi:MAG: hypothetical protein IIX01_00215, partial [Clostridia bacterium]|nr:hypothetical protein [Clostridia bacterium]